MFFALRPATAILSDSNAQLINTYRAIRANWRLVRRYLTEHQYKHSKIHYYACRDRVFRSLSSRAAQFLYLNRACWNGLYRVNLLGKFNVPIGTKDTIVFDSDDFESVASLLRRAELRHCDFETTINLASRNDFIFVDPPYTVNHNTNGFLKYNEEIFSWKDQLRLRESLRKALKRGAKILVTNADHCSIKELYRDFGDVLSLPRFSVLSGDPAFRRRSTELVVRAGF